MLTDCHRTMRVIITSEIKQFKYIIYLIRERWSMIPRVSAPSNAQLDHLSYSRRCMMQGTYPFPINFYKQCCRLYLAHTRRFKQFRSNKRKNGSKHVLDQQAAVQLALCDSSVVANLLSTFWNILRFHDPINTWEVHRIIWSTWN
jgi:hypothetical protein